MRIGANLTKRGVEFRVWAPDRQRVAVTIAGRDHPLAPEENGYFAGLVEAARAGTRYRFRLDDEGDAYPDPASRWQPDGPHGDSVVVDPSFPWKDADWGGPRLEEAIITEIHIGTFTPEGTYAAAIEKLPLLADVGINVLELMPVNEFPGRFGWGYDGVDLFAPTRLYGTPDDLRRFVDAAHARHLAVIHDVVYNHFGPDGCYLSKYARGYFTDKYENEWGEAVAFEGEARTFFIENAAYWIEEYHFDGLRIDATQSMFDQSEPHVLREIADAARAAAGERSILLIAENEPQQSRLVRELGLDAMWNDDFHHSARVALTGFAEAYYSDYRGLPQELVSMARHGFLYQGQRYQWQKKRRGTPSLDLPPEKLVCYLENHDQVANSANGARLHALTAPAMHRAMTALLLLAPQTPMLFQGEEWGSSKPFLYFADHEPELAEKVRKGRHDFLAQFPSIATLKALPLPHDESTFEACKLDWRERERNAPIVDMHRDLIRLRRGGPVDGAVLAGAAFLLRWPDRLLIVNLGAALHLDPAPEPLLAPPAGKSWELLWSSEAPEYGGAGTPDLESDENWRIPARCAVLMSTIP